jgi:hypothetical protein
VSTISEQISSFRDSYEKYKLSVRSTESKESEGEPESLKLKLAVSQTMYRDFKEKGQTLSAKSHMNLSPEQILTVSKIMSNVKEIRHLQKQENQAYLFPKLPFVSLVESQTLRIGTTYSTPGYVTTITASPHTAEILVQMGKEDFTLPKSCQQLSRKFPTVQEGCNTLKAELESALKKNQGQLRQMWMKYSIEQACRRSEMLFKLRAVLNKDNTAPNVSYYLNNMTDYDKNMTQDFMKEMDTIARFFADHQAVLEKEMMSMNGLRRREFNTGWMSIIAKYQDASTKLRNGFRHKMSEFHEVLNHHEKIVGILTSSSEKKT